MTTSAAFDRGAPHYDLMVHLNPGYHRELRRAATALAGRLTAPAPRLLDIGCGSGASTRALSDAVEPDASIQGLDASPGMLAVARSKPWPPDVRFSHAISGELDIQALGASSHDGVMACYLFRNVPAEHRDHAISEVFDLLRPGGWLVVQEYSVDGNRAARRVWDVVSHAVIIPLGVLIDRDPHLHTYLWRSVIDFDSVDRFADRLVQAGFTDVAHRTATGWQRGILHTFIARRPEEQS